MVVSNAPPTKLFFDMSNRQAKQAGKKPWLVRQNYPLEPQRRIQGNHEYGAGISKQLNRIALAASVMHGIE